MSKNAQFIYGGGGDVTLYDATNGWYHLGYLSELKLTGTPSTAPTNHGQMVQFMMLYKVELRGLQTNAALITELTDRRTVEQTIYIVGGGKMYTLTGMMLSYGPQLPFNSADAHALVVSAQTAVEPSWAENLLGSYGTFETDTNTDGICDGWTNSSLTSYSQEAAFSGGDGSYSQQIEFADDAESYLICDKIRLPFESTLKLTVSALVSHVEEAYYYFRVQLYDTSDSVISTHVSSQLGAASGISRQSHSFIITPGELVKDIQVDIYRDDTGTPAIQIDSFQVEIGGLRDFRDE